MEIEDIANRLGISGRAFMETASYEIYSRAKGLTGLPQPQLQAASVYASCRLFGIPRTLKDVSTASCVEIVGLARCYRRIVVDVDLRLPVQVPAAYVSGIAGRAGLDASTERRALEILEVAKKARVTAGKLPAAVAAAALYAAYTETHPESEAGADGRVTQKGFARCAGVAEVTIRHRLLAIRWLLKEASEIGLG